MFSHSEDLIELGCCDNCDKFRAQESNVLWPYSHDVYETDLTLELSFMQAKKTLTGKTGWLGKDD